MINLGRKGLTNRDVHTSYVDSCTQKILHE